MNMLRSTRWGVLALGLAYAFPAPAYAAVLYNEIIVQDAVGGIVAAVVATPAVIAADPNAIFYVPGIAIDPTEFGNYGIVVDDSGNPYQLFGIGTGGPDETDLAFALQGTASAYFVQNPVADTGAPIDLTTYLDPDLQSLGDTATLLSSGTDSGIPEPLTWAMMAVGFAAIGSGMRRSASLRQLASSGR